MVYKSPTTNIGVFVQQIMALTIAMPVWTVVNFDRIQVLPAWNCRTPTDFKVKKFCY